MMITPKVRNYAAEFKKGAVALFVKYEQTGDSSYLNQFNSKTKGFVPDVFCWNEDAPLKEIELQLASLPQSEREIYLFEVITAFKDWAQSKDSLRENISQYDYVWKWVNSFRLFVVKLDAMLLKHGIDMMRLQEECDVYLQNERSLTAVARYIGSEKLAKKYIDAIQAKREPQQEEKNATEPREINQERLREYFTLKFSGKNNMNTDYFKEYLLPKLMEKMNAKYYAKIFLLMYQSPNLKSTMKPRTFTKFYEDMCEITGVEFINGYKPNQLTMTSKEKKDYYYLTDKIT